MRDCLFRQPIKLTKLTKQMKPTKPVATPSFRFTILVSLFCVILVISNIASTKMTQFAGLTLDAGTILFPLSYIFGDIFAEVYGWKVSKKIILLGFAAIVLNALILAIVQYLPVASFWENQSSYENIL